MLRGELRIGGRAINPEFALAAESSDLASAIS
jgi:hypothetical protein